MADFVNQIRKKLGLEPKRDRTETGKVPNEIKINRLQNEIAGYPVPVIPTPGVVYPDAQYVGDDKNIKSKNEKDKINLKRRKARKRFIQAVDDLGEDIDPSTKPYSTATSMPVPTANVITKKAKTMQEIFGPTTPGEHGSPKYGDIMYEIKPPKRKKDQRHGTSDSYGKTSELLFGRHLNNGNHAEHYRAQGKTPEEMHDHHAQLLFGHDYTNHPHYKRLNEAARQAAEKYKKHLKDEHGITHITSVAWTSEKKDHKKETAKLDPEGKGIDDPNNKADLIITGKSKENSKLRQIATSIKSKHPDSERSETNYANHGLRTLSNHSGHNFESDITLNEMKKKHSDLVNSLLNPKGEKITEDERHARYKEYKAKRDTNDKNEIAKSSNSISEYIARKHAEGLSKKLKTDDDHIAHIKKTISAAGHVHGGNELTGKTHLPHDVVSIAPSYDNNHQTGVLPFSKHADKYLDQYRNFKVEHSGQSVKITAEHKDTGNREVVHKTNVYAGGRPEMIQQRTSTILPGEKKYLDRNASLKEQAALLEHVQSIISEAKGRGADSEGHKRPTEQGAGLTRKGVEAYRRENPGSKLKTAVTTPPSKLKPGSKAANRRKSFCARMGGMPGPMKDEKGRPTRKAMSLRRWNCEANEILMSLVEAKKMTGKDPCWKNYEMVGTKEKDGRTVPNCVPVDEMSVPLGTTGKKANWNPPMVGIRMASGKIEKHPPGKSGSSGGGNGGDE